MSEKPTGKKAYGHIAHLPGSRLGPGDHHCPPGQARICLEKCRDRHDLVIVTEKLDGSNASVAKVNGEVIALSRAGYRAISSPYAQHHLFDRWAMQRYDLFYKGLEDGERVCGEWLAQAHGTRYDLPHPPFVAFDFFVGDRRLPYDDFLKRAAALELPIARLLHYGGPYSIETALRATTVSGHGALDPVEGAVWRVERRGECDFLAKFVRPGKADGKYLESVSGGAPVWNRWPGRDDYENQRFPTFPPLEQ